MKAAVLIGAASVVVICARRTSAATRHAVLLAAMIGALAVPWLNATLPTPAPVSRLVGRAPASLGHGRLADGALGLVLARTDATSAPPVASSPRAVAERWSDWILVVWFTGTAALLVRIAADLTAARRVMARAVLSARLARGIPLLESREVASPVVVGLFRPVILVPKGTPIGTSAGRSVILHELAHVERRDCLTQLVVRIACAFYWFNPLAWWAARRIVLERERACDERVLASGADPFEYSRLLLDMARRGARPALRPRALPSMAQSAHLEKRIVGILAAAAPRPGLSRRRKAAIALVAGFVVVLVATLGVHDALPVDAGRDPYLDPESERAPGPRVFDRSMISDPETPDGVLIATLRGAARREPTGPYDLVPDRARWALSMARDGSILEPLRGALSDPDWRVRAYAAWALGVAGDPSAVEPLLRLLDDPVWRLRAMAAFALREIGAARAAPALAGALDDPAWQVRVEAAAYFGKLRDTRFRQNIELLLRDPHIAVRMAAREALDTM